jgi:hypothetical protein
LLPVNHVLKIPVVDKLLYSDNPSIRYKTKAYLLDEDPDSLKEIRESIRTGPIAKALLSHREADGTIKTNPYKKWQGPHWTLYCLALIDYPAGDTSLIPLREQIYNWLFQKEHLKFPRSLLIKGQENRFRRCASQEGNAVWYSIRLGLEDERTRLLAERLIKWQWPDGGWNCDKRPAARCSSFMESLIPLRALYLFSKRYNHAKAYEYAERTAEFLLSRRLYKRKKDGSIIHPSFIQIHYPFTFYDILFALTAMNEIGKIKDRRCQDALKLLKSKQLSDGGFPLEDKNWKTTDTMETRGTLTDWGYSGKKRMNEYVTVNAVSILRAADLL